MSENKYNVNVKNLDKSEVEVTISIPESKFKEAQEKKFKELSKKVDVPGFRAGKAPRDVVMSKLGPVLFEETLSELLPNVTVEVLEAEGLTPVDSVKYDIEEFKEEGDIKYKATFPVYPEVKIGNLKKVKVKKQTVKVTDEDVDNVLKQMFEDWKTKEKLDMKAAAKAEGKEWAKEDEEKIVYKYAEPTDEWAEKETHLGVKNLNELKAKVKEEVGHQKEHVAESEYHNQIIAGAIKQTTMDIPESFINRELDRRVAEYKGRIEGMGLKFEDFLRVQKTTEEDLRKEWSDNAKAYIESELFLLQFAKDQEVKVTEEEVQKQIDDVQDAKTKEQFDNPQGRDYIRQALLRQNAFNRLVKVVEGK